MAAHDPHDLTPANATALEREMARLSARLDEIDPSVIETIWDAWRCPSALLPYLAWALSVDVWQDGWDEIRKRQAIADSPRFHRMKGTRAAVDDALVPLLLPIALYEWHQMTPAGRSGTARLLVNVGVESPAALTARADLGGFTRMVRRLVATAKPKSRAIEIMIGQFVDGAVSVRSAVGVSLDCVVEAYQPRLQWPVTPAHVRSALGLTIDTVVNPQ